MNNVFDIRRFTLVVTKHWSDNRNKYLLSLGAIFALMLIWMAFLMLMAGYRPLRNDMQYITFYVGLFLTGSLFASMLFGDLANKPKAINFLTVPASHLEKLLCSLLFAVVIFLASYTLIFYIADTIMVKVSNVLEYRHWQENVEFINGVRQPFTPEKVVNVFYSEEITRNAPFDVMLFILTVFLTVQATYALGSLYFPNYSFIKTTLFILILILFFVFFFAKVLYPMMPSGDFDGKGYFRLHENWNAPEYQAIQIPAWYVKFFFGPAKYILVLVMWTAAYFRLKEKEV